MRNFSEKPIPNYEEMLSKGGKEIGLLCSPYHQITEEMWKSCAKLYCQIWREPPWNEYFWEEEKVLLDIKRELKRPGAEAFLAVQNCLVNPIADDSDAYSVQVIGFTWGYLVDRKDLREISNGFLLDKLFNEEEMIFYIDELAIASCSRRRRIGESLSGLLIMEAKRKKEVSKIVLRTDKKAVAAKNLYSKMGFKDLEVKDLKYPDRTYWLLEL